METKKTEKLNKIQRLVQERNAAEEKEEWMEAAIISLSLAKMHDSERSQAVAYLTDWARFCEKFGVIINPENLRRFIKSFPFKEAQMSFDW